MHELWKKVSSFLANTPPEAIPISGELLIHEMLPTVTEIYLVIGVLFGETWEAGGYWGLRRKMALWVRHMEGEDCLNLFKEWGLPVNTSYPALRWYFLFLILSCRGRTAKGKGVCLATENLWCGQGILRRRCPWVTYCFEQEISPLPDSCVWTPGLQLVALIL